MPTTHVEIEVDSLGKLLQLWRLVAGMSQQEVAVKASALMPSDESISSQSVLRYERPEMEVTFKNLLAILAITRALGHTKADLPSEVLDKIDAVSRLLR